MTLTDSSPAKSSPLVAYGSHTGQAEAIAKQLADRLSRLGCEPRVFQLNENEKKFHLESEPLALVICSSTGDGDAPENAARFIRRLARVDLPKDFLAKTSYALLGLGDSNYSTFQGVPRRIKELFDGLSAQKINPAAEADDATGLEEVVEPWLTEVVRLTAQFYGLPEEKLTADRVQLAPKKSEAEKLRIRAALDVSMARIDKSTAHSLRLVDFDYAKSASLRSGAENLSADPNLRVPVAPEPFLSVSIEEGELFTERFDSASDWQCAAPFPGRASLILETVVAGQTRLSSTGHPVVHKPKFELLLDLVDFANAEIAPDFKGADIHAGDAFYVCFENDPAEVDWLLERMDLLDVADRVCKTDAKAGDGPKRFQRPPHIPERSSLRHIFSRCLDIRRTPGRPILRLLADAEGTSQEDRRRLLELCSAQGVSEYTTFVRQSAISLVDLLAAFPSVRPPVERLIEQLPRLLPRPYSLASAPRNLASRGRLRFVYSALKFEAGKEARRYQRHGAATDWLVQRKMGDRVTLIFKEPVKFRLPQSTVADSPLLMIGPGSGIAPFLSLLEEKEFSLDEKTETHTSKWWLLGGCRHGQHDAIFGDQLALYARLGLLERFTLAESAKKEDETKEPGYVQDALRRHAKEVHQFLSLPDSRLFVCGDARAMSRDIFSTLADILQTHEGLSAADAQSRLLTLKKQDRYIEDVWA